MCNIHSLWIGDRLSYLELLTLKSFINNGYTFNLWVYDDKLLKQVPAKVNLCDANKILPQSRIFSYKNRGDCRSGSYGGFSDIFRYYLLYTQGGVYVDMDVTCLAPYSFDKEYVIRPHCNAGTVANILKAPKNSAFLKDCIEITEKEINENNNEWVKPVKIFDKCVNQHNLSEYIVDKSVFGDDAENVIYKYKFENYFLIKHLLPKYAIHWCRETSFGRWSLNQMYDWNTPKPFSVFYNLLQKNKIL